MLSDVKLRAAKPEVKPYKLADGHQLYLLVTPTGSKLWRMNYAYGCKQKSLSIGSYPLVSLIDARRKRDDARRQLQDGKDPAIEKRLLIGAQIEADQNTFERVARCWYATCRSQWANVHANDVMRSLERDVFPAVGAFPVASLKAPRILEVLRVVENRSAIETAKRIRQRISAVFVYAIASGIADSDPAAMIAGALKPLPPKTPQPSITDLVRLRQLLSDTELCPARPVTRLALHLLALTAVRPGELRGARWDELENLEGDALLWRIPATRMKGDLNRKRERGGDHLVPLSKQSVAVITVLKGLTGNGDLMFPSARHIHRPMSENAIGYMLNRAGYHGRHVPHGWRSAFSTIMNEWAISDGQNGDRQIIDLMLAHVPENKVEGAYNRAEYMPRRRALAQIWADKLMLGVTRPADFLDLPAQ